MTHIDILTANDLWKRDTDGFLPVMFEVYNPDIVWTDKEKSIYGQEDCYLRFINDDMKVRYKNKTYLPCAFEYKLPDSDGSKIGSSSITISALDARVRRLLRSIKLPSDFTVVAAFGKMQKESGKYTYSFKELNSITYRMSTASSNKSTATFNLTFNRSLGVNVPIDVASQDRVPGTQG